MLLRDYQKDIINKTIASTKSTLIQIPTGGGKTVIVRMTFKRATNRGDIRPPHLEIFSVTPFYHKVAGC